MSVEGTDKQNSGEIVRRGEIKNTPFELIQINGDQEKGSFIAWGKFRLTEVTVTEEDTDKLTDRVINLEKGGMDWELMAVLATCIGMNVNNITE